MNTLNARDHVVIIGAGLAGWRLVQSLRTEGYDGAITLVGDESHAPYDRPPLSKQILTGKWPLERCALATREHLDASRVELRLGVRAVSLRSASMSVDLDDGTSLRGTHLVIATGSRARPLAYASSGPLMTLRSVDDARVLLKRCERLVHGDTVVVIGGGFLGAEVATSLKARGLTPVVLEVDQRPLRGALGDDVSTWLAPMSDNHAIEMRANQHIVDVRPSGGGYVVDFVDGSHLEANEVVAAVGSVLELEWLANSGVELDHGVVVDEHLECGSNVAAIGDVAKFPLVSALGRELVRIEHWQVAIDHAAQLARWWVKGTAREAPLVPYFWSDQYGKKLQMLGHPHPSDHVIMVEGDVKSGAWLGLYSRHDVVTGVIALSKPRALMLAKSLIDHPTSIEDALRRAPWRDGASGSKTTA